MKSFKTFLKESYLKATRIYMKRRVKDASSLVKNPLMTPSEKIKYAAYKAANDAREVAPEPMNVTGVGSGLGYTAAALVGKPALEIKAIRDRMVKK